QRSGGARLHGGAPLRIASDEIGRRRRLGIPADCRRGEAPHEGDHKSTRHVPHGAPPESSHGPTTTSRSARPHLMRIFLYKLYLTYSLYFYMSFKSSGMFGGEAEARLLAPEGGGRIMEFGMLVSWVVGGVLAGQLSRASTKCG